jgi:hypothetical protein
MLVRIVLKLIAFRTDLLAVQSKVEIIRQHADTRLWVELLQA